MNITYPTTISVSWAEMSSLDHFDKAVVSRWWDDVGIKRQNNFGAISGRQRTNNPGTWIHSVRYRRRWRRWRAQQNINRVLLSPPTPYLQLQLPQSGTAFTGSNVAHHLDSWSEGRQQWRQTWRNGDSSVKLKSHWAARLSVARHL